MLIDEVEVVVKAGDGGAGIVAWNKPPLRGPSGGSGGKGGDVYAVAKDDLMLLRAFIFNKNITAANGKRGEINQRTGRDGEDVDIWLPSGSVITDLDTGEEWELNREGERIKLGKGGNGGRGNYELRSATLTTPKFAKQGGKGQERKLRVVLKLVADYGLIGLPNTGKSSLLNELTAAKAPVAQYPFTTLSPNLGVLNRKVIADIPGLIEGASKGKGLGIKFLKHIEKVGWLLHCIAADSEDIAKDYKTVKQELEQYSKELGRKPELILLTKSDLVEEKKLKQQVSKLKKLNPKIETVSIYDWERIESLKKVLEKTGKGGSE